MSDILMLGQNFVALFLESAPWLLLGLLVAGIMHELVPVTFLERHMGNNSVGAITKAAVIGAPLPLCSCGVIPAALGLRRSGASTPSTISFLVSTPETGVDSVSVSYALLGPLYAIVRPIAAIVSAIYAGLMVRLFNHAPVAKVSTHDDGHGHRSSTSQSTCCSSKAEVIKVETNQHSCCDSTTVNALPVKEDTCCSGEAKADAPAHAGVFSTGVVKSGQVVSYASGKLLDDIVKWLLIGLALAAAIKTWVPTDFLTQWGDGVIAMLVMAVIGIPMYICATASTPLAVGFLAAGLSPGAVLVFLMAGPATNVSTMGMIKQEMGSKTLVTYLFSVVSASIAFGYLVNWAVSAFSLQGLIKTEGALHQHGADVQAIYALCAVVLAGLIVRLYIKKMSALNRVKHESSHCCG
jgi:uncharacterized membrane protein YraQ (UPF0718 family)